MNWQDELTKKLTKKLTRWVDIKSWQNVLENCVNKISIFLLSSEKLVNKICWQFTAKMSSQNMCWQIELTKWSDKIGRHIYCQNELTQSDDITALQTHPCNENRDFPVYFFSQGKVHRENPVLALHWPCMGLQCIFFSWPKPKKNHEICTLCEVALQSRTEPVQGQNRVFPVYFSQTGKKLFH